MAVGSKATARTATPAGTSRSRTLNDVESLITVRIEPRRAATHRAAVAPRPSDHAVGLHGSQRPADVFGVPRCAL
jgi:hypothetical protein